MKNIILELGNALSKSDQKKIHGGLAPGGTEELIDSNCLDPSFKKCFAGSTNECPTGETCQMASKANEFGKYKAPKEGVINVVVGWNSHTYVCSC